MPPIPPRPQSIIGYPAWRSWARRIALFAGLWWILTGGAAASWWIGAPIVLVSAWLSQELWVDPPLSVVGVLRFVPYFVRQSVAGATDVAFRALHPAMPLHPGLVRHRLRLPAGASRVALANVVSMLPGTLSADLDGDQLLIHALDTRTDLHSMVVDLEPRIALVFGFELDAGTAAASSQ